jgi:molybdopterin molybdotransferase
MAQLIDDCFASSGLLLPLADMELRIAERVVPVVETEMVALAGARCRVLAQDIGARLDLQPFENSAVGGYAVRHAGLAADCETWLAVVGRLAGPRRGRGVRGG